MGCRSDYQRDDPSEIEAAKVLALLHELEFDIPVNPEDYGKTTGEFYTYGKYTDEDLDYITAKLCTQLQTVNDISKYSLEMQIWWRDHKTADTKRLIAELKKKRTEKQKQAAIAKLTPHERKLLGL